MGGAGNREREIRATREFEEGRERRTENREQREAEAEAEGGRERERERERVCVCVCDRGSERQRERGEGARAWGGGRCTPTVELAGTVPSDTRVALKNICFPSLPPQRRLDIPSNGSTVCWNTSSVRALLAGAMRHWYPPPWLVRIVLIVQNAAGV